MGVETATFVGDLVASNPGSSDLRSQGDDHIRLIKLVLQNSFPGLERAFAVAKFAAKSANYTIVGTEDQTTFFIDTSGGAVTLTLPTLVAGDAGWSIRFYKFGANANPVFVAPPTGNLYSGQFSLPLARRCIPGIAINVFWNGSAFVVERALALPIGAMIDFDSATLPSGFEWPNGQTLSGTTGSVYPEYFAAKAALTTLDLRGRVAVTLDNLGGSAAGRLAGGIITGTAVGNTGGSDTRALLLANLPPYTPLGTVTNGTIQATNVTFASVVNGGQLAFSTSSTGTVGGNLQSALNLTQGASTFTGTAQGGTSTAFGILQPGIMCSKILVVE